MNTLISTVTVFVLVIAFYFGKQLWTKETRSAYTRSVARSMETLEDIKDHAKEFNKKEVIKVHDNIYMAIGYALANSIMIIGPEGVVIVDVTESVTAGLEILHEFRKITDKPITDIIYSHNHADHTLGAKAFIEENSTVPNIWAHASITKAFALQFRGANVAGYTRAMRQFGVFLPDISAGIGFKLRLDTQNPSIGLVYPTRLVNDTYTDVVLAGIPMKIVHIPGETDDQIGVWLPQQNAFLCADDLYKAFPNLYAIRGTPPRNLLQWVSSLDIMIDLEPEFLVPSHTRPIQGKEEVMKLLIEYRDAIQFVHDQTIRFINYGYHPDEIANMLVLPESLNANPYLKEFYGTLAWSSKSVFAENMGWFSGDPVELHPLTRDDKAERMVEMVGVDKLVKTAQAAFAANDFQWALELSSHVLRFDSKNKAARDIKTEALTSLGARQISNNGRNYYLTCALEVATDLKLRRPPSTTKVGLVNSFPIAYSISSLSIVFKPEECSHKNETLYIQLTDPTSHHVLQIRNSVVITKHTVPKHWDIKVKTTETTWKDIMVNKRNTAAALAFGDLEIEGGVFALNSFFSCFDKNVEQIDFY